MMSAVIVEVAVQFTLVELSRVCQVEVGQLVDLVHEGVLTPKGDDLQTWRFDGAALCRARVAVRLSRDLELSAPATAVVLDLLEEIAELRSKLRRRCPTPDSSSR
jgi:chaperone modulatory protein CbpM